MIMLVFTVSANDSNNSKESNEIIAHDCVDATLKWMDRFPMDMYSDSDLSCFGNVYYAQCEGYSISMQECF